MRFPLNFIYFLIFIFSIGCTAEKSSYLPRHSGAPGEVLIIMPEDQWTGEAGEELRKYLQVNAKQLPQAEPIFKLLHFSPSEISDLLKHHRNIISVEIDENYQNSTPRMELSRNKWSNHQLVFTLKAKDIASLDTLLANNSPKLIDIINKTEKDRLQSRYAEYPNEFVRDTIKKVHGISINFPDDVELVKNNDGFFWVKRERVKYIGNTAHDITQGFFVYSYPYSQDSAFTQKQLLEVRDSLLKTNVPGPTDGTYMTTEHKYPPESVEVNFNGNYAVETRGLWKTANFFMGGSFISLTFLNEDNTKVISVSGFVFAPKFDKREFVRELEAVIYSAKPA